MGVTLHSRKAIAALGAAILAMAALGAAAQAEMGANGNLRVAFSGGISPMRLPRQGVAPVTVLMGAKISTTDRSVPPELKTMVLDINAHGKINPDGLPTCPEAELNSISAAGAKRACGGALVGHGNVTTRITLPENPTFATNGGLLAFNGRLHGHPAVFAQVSSGAPLPLTYVIAFEIKKLHGKYGTALVGTVPPIASSYGKISAINLSLHRTYVRRGRNESFVSASCPAPSGFGGSTFSFAKVSFSFAEGRSVGSTLTRECKAS